MAHVSVRCPAVEGAGDDSRHALMCGIMAAEYRAMSVSAVDRCITNRHLVIQGDAGYVVSMPETTGEKKKRFIQFMQGDEKGSSFFLGEAYMYNYIIYVIIYIYIH